MPSKENLHLTINTKETHPDLEQREVLDDRKSGEEKIETAESQKDIRRLYDSATAYIAQRNVQQMEEAMKSPHWREEIPPTTSLASAIEQFKQSRSGRKSIKEKARQLSWKIGGIESSNEVRALVDYIETHIPSYEHKTVSVKKEKAETIKEKYEAEGYYVRIDEFSSRKKRENEVILSMSHDVPYRPSRTEVGRIATLLHQPNDPIELLERLKDLKVYLTPYMFENEKNFEVLKEYASTPGIMDFLKKMQGAGIKSRYMTMSRGFGSSEKSIEQIRETVKDPEKVAVFSDQVIARLSEMTRKDLELALDDFDHLQQVAEFISDDNAYRLWHTLNDSQVSGYQRGNASLFNLIRLQKSGLLDTVMEVSGNNTELASSILSHLDKKDIGQYTDSPEELTDAVKARIHSPEVQKLASDPKFREFITQASVLIDKRINLEDLELYRPLYEQGSTGIAFLEVCRESGITITDQHLRQYPLSDFLPKQAMKVLSRPDFPHFVQQLQEQLSYKATLRDLLDYDSLGYNYEEARKTGGQLSYFFQNKTLKNILTTQEGAQLIHLFGPFDARKTNLYEWIGSIPHAYNILNQLKQSFDFDPELINHNFYLIESLRRVCDKESLRQSLFNPETQDFYEKMRDIYAYQLILPQVEQFVEAAQDNNLAATIFKPENIPFIKEVCVLGTGQYVFESLQRFKRLDPGMKELVGTLHRDFKFSIDHTFDAVLPKLNILKESPVMLPTAHMLREHGFSFDIIQELDRLEHTIEYGLENAIIRQEGHPQLQRFIFENTKDLAKIPQEKLDSYLEVLMSIDDSPSQEIQRLRSSLLQQIIHTSDPAATYRKVESVFVKNNLPTVGKAYKVFEMFYTPDVIEQKLKTGNHGSPVLTSAS
ncbi:MAG: hypothetical protein U1A25_00945, partial [Candidatus Sungbacteria bacterium]|nr:hypothetical protein [Candidatus Sungbacteria bacterium]